MMGLASKKCEKMAKKCEKCIFLPEFGSEAGHLQRILGEVYLSACGRV
jgi:hypothetical protein